MRQRPDRLGEVSRSRVAQNRPPRSVMLWPLAIAVLAGMAAVADGLLTTHREDWRATQSLIGGAGFLALASSVRFVGRGRARPTLALLAAVALFAAGTMRFWH